MKPIPGTLALAAAPLLAFGLAWPAEEGKIYECTDAKGQVVYQDEPCLEAVPSLAKLPAVPKPKRKPTAKSKPPAVPPPAPPASPRATEPAPPGRPLDARWATPEKTLKTFVGAVIAGDRALVLSCLTASALADLGPDLEALPLEKLRETVGSFTGYVAEGDLGPFWSIRALRAGMRPKWIFFERTGSGEWKIAGI